jgi:hypothetical protein
MSLFFHLVSGLVDAAFYTSSFLQFSFGSRVGLARLCFYVYLSVLYWFHLPDFVGFVSLLPFACVSFLSLYCHGRVVFTLFVWLLGQVFVPSAFLYFLFSFNICFFAYQVIRNHQ